MAISPELSHFAKSWLAKSENTDTTNLEGCFDKFFTLYVLFNRLYAEAAFVLARRGQVNLQQREWFPDRDAAVDYTAQFLGSRTIVDAIAQDVSVSEALSTVEQLLEIVPLTVGG